MKEYRYFCDKCGADLGSDNTTLWAVYDRRATNAGDCEDDVLLFDVCGNCVRKLLQALLRLRKDGEDSMSFYDRGRFVKEWLKCT